VAALIDGILLAGLYLVLFIFSAVLRTLSDALATFVVFVGYLPLSLYWLYLGYLEGQTGQSPGKSVTGLKVVRQTDGQLIGAGMGVVRKIAHFLDGICFIGYLFPLWDPMRQTFADKILTTVVLRDQQKRPFGPDLFMPQKTGQGGPPPPPASPPPT
jgi:uncharacterized RDD family membrane protein YckC